MGQLKETIAICSQQLDFAKEHNLLQTIFVGWALALWALALAERNELDQALGYAERSQVLTQGGDIAFASFSLIVLAKTHFYRGDFAMAASNVTARRAGDRCETTARMPSHGAWKLQ